MNRGSWHANTRPGRRTPLTTAEQPPPEGDEQPPQATDGTEEDADAQSPDANHSQE
jgi:hypothetical protein